MWDLIVSVPDHCLSLYFFHPLQHFINQNMKLFALNESQKRRKKIF